MKNTIITILIISNLFLMLCVVSMINTVDNVRVENDELWAMVDRTSPDADENF